MTVTESAKVLGAIAVGLGVVVAAGLAAISDGRLNTSYPSCTIREHSEN
jgi:serine acetyltransferase